MKFFSFKSSNKSQKTSKKQPAPQPMKKEAKPVKKEAEARVCHSPSQSISSAASEASMDTLCANDTHIRGIFRTLEPVWSYLPTNDEDQWVTLDAEHAQGLEKAFQSRAATTAVQIDSTDYFVRLAAPLAKKKQPATTAPRPKRARPVTQLFNKSATSLVPPHHQNKSSLSVPAVDADKTKRLSMPAARSRSSHDVAVVDASLLVAPLPPLPPQKPQLQLGKNLRRAMVPSWWYEQDDDMGRKGMARFDYKNQVRLEALSDGRSSLVMTDDAFQMSFRVELEPADRSLLEEWRGFLYMTAPTPIMHPAFPIMGAHKRMSYYPPPQQHQFFPQIHVQDMDPMYNDAPLVRRSSF
ncbi:hypothetical protein BC940DRAFT_143859 [Gongronella butleri]|nr:hypothetical protein BC940DRAFT_143859 [Gongronella butleri]